MTEEYFTNKDEKLGFKQIVLSHIHAILKITLNPGLSSSEVAKFQKSYIGSVSALSDVLVSFYDDEMKKDYADFVDKYNELTENHIKKGRSSARDVKNLIAQKCNLSRVLFRKLNLLISRVAFLKNAVYSEDDFKEDAEFD